MLRRRKHAGETGPDPVDARVWIVRTPLLQRLHERAVDHPRRGVSLGRELVERPGDAGGAAVETACRPVALGQRIGSLERPASGR